MNTPDFIALISYKTTEEGGRKSPAHNDYMPLIEFPGLMPFTGGRQSFIDKEIVYPGENVKTMISILSVEKFRRKLFVGQKINICEIPGIIIGTGEILEIVNKDLEK